MDRCAFQRPARFIFPDGSALEGVWKDGEMEAAAYVSTDVREETFSAARARSRARAQQRGGDGGGGGAGSADVPLYAYDRPGTTAPSSQPMLPDPYESRTTYVKQSDIPTCPGEGLFAKVDIPVSENTFNNF